MPSVDIQRISLVPTQTINLSNKVFGVAGGAVQLCDVNPDRRFVRIENTGLSSLWFGASSNVTVGATGLNIGTITKDSAALIEGFGGALWGTFTGLSHATAHVVKVFEY
jgi:hypothetical protein